MDFDTAFEHLLKIEGGYNNHPSDPGLETMYGITIKVARSNGYNGPMRSMPVEVAKVIYRKRFWDASRCEEMPPVIRYALFDAAVNSGVTQAVKWLQRAARVNDDGVIGPKTLEAVRGFNGSLLLCRMISQRLKFMTDLKGWESFGKGWARRLAALLDA